MSLIPQGFVKQMRLCVSEKIAGSLVAIKAIYGRFTEAFFINKTYIMRASAFYIVDRPFFADIIVLLRTSNNIDLGEIENLFLKYFSAVFLLSSILNSISNCCFLYRGKTTQVRSSGMDMTVFTP